MITITASTTGIAPNGAGNPAEANSVEEIEHRRFFEPDADVVTLRFTPEQALDVIEDMLAQVGEETGQHLVVYQP